MSSRHTPANLTPALKSQAGAPFFHNAVHSGFVRLLWSWNWSAGWSSAAAKQPHIQIFEFLAGTANQQLLQHFNISNVHNTTQTIRFFKMHTADNVYKFQCQQWNVFLPTVQHSLPTMIRQLPMFTKFATHFQGEQQPSDNTPIHLFTYHVQTHKKLGTKLNDDEQQSEPTPSFLPNRPPKPAFPQIIVKVSHTCTTDLLYTELVTHITYLLLMSHVDASLIYSRICVVLLPVLTATQCESGYVPLGSLPCSHSHK